MSRPQGLILGEYCRTIDDRYRLSVPAELLQQLGDAPQGHILAKERPGCLSLWNTTDWKGRLEESVGLVAQKIQAGRLRGRLGEVQLLGRLLSTRHVEVMLAGRGRLLLPEGFRQFLGVEPNGEVVIVGAAICVEIWNPAAWLAHLRRRMPKFRRLLEQLSE
jgi:MraZ protein